MAAQASRRESGPALEAQSFLAAAAFEDAQLRGPSSGQRSAFERPASQPRAAPRHDVHPFRG
eukprot:15297304-Alexandrium_andersonii.AAC.1